MSEVERIGPELPPWPEPDEDTSFFWDAARQQQLVLHRCTACGQLQYPPDVVCVYCQSQDLEPEQLSGRGALYSFAVVRRAFHGGFLNALPYVVALVELQEQPGLRMLTNLVDVDPGQLRVGMPVEVTFEERGAVTLPQFRPAVDVR
jgi:uncharacterized OB-fold protein